MDTPCHGNCASKAVIICGPVANCAARRRKQKRNASALKNCTEEAGTNPTSRPKADLDNLAIAAQLRRKKMLPLKKTATR